MARNETNFENFLYTDDNAVDWTKRGEIGQTGTSSIDGHAAGTGAPVWINSSRMQVRRCILQDPTTYRTRSFVVYTPTAFSAITLGSTVAIEVVGLATTVNYTVVKKIPEKQPFRGVSRKLADT